MIRKLAHINLITDRMDALVDFYTLKLGFSITFIFRNADNQIFGYYLASGDSTFIEIFDRVLKHKQWGGELTPLQKGNQFAHLCFEVTGLTAFKKTLEARGVKLSDVREGMDGSFQSWTSDPDGNAIELMEYTHRSWQIHPDAPK